MKRALTIIIVMFFCINADALDKNEDNFKWRYKAYKKKERDPGISFVLSWMIPGAGQFYNKEYKKGAISLIGNLLLYGLIAYTGEGLHLEHKRVYEHPYNMLGAVSLLGHMVVSSNHAHYSSLEINKDLKLKYFIYKDVYDCL